MTKFFEYTDSSGVKREAETYIASDFVTLSAPNAPVKTKSNGLLDPSIIPPTISGEAAAVVVTRTAEGAVSRGDALRAHSTGKVTVGDPTSGLAEASVLGVALDDAAHGEDVRVLVLGVISDPIFSVFSVNTPLFLDVSGGITDVKRTTGYHTVIGKHLGGTEVLVNVQSPVKLGV